MPKAPAWLLLVVAALLAAAALWAHQSAVAGSTSTLNVQAAQWQHIKGHLYYADLPQLRGEADTNEQPLRSPYRLQENGKVVGLAHAAHQSIIDTGLGYYSHWQNGFYISAPDNSDPTSNGRSYSLLKVTPVNDILTWMLGAAALVAALVGGAPLARSAARSLFAGLRQLSTEQTLLTVANILVAFVVLWTAFGFERRAVLDSAGAANTGGFMYFIALPWAEGSADTNTQPTRSPMRVTENGIDLGPAHSAHADIVGKGEGRFSHWDTGIAFSASDNTDVRANGRTYQVRMRIGPPYWVLGGAAFLWLIALTLVWRKQRTLTLSQSAGLPALLAAILLLPMLALATTFFGDQNAAADLATQLRAIEQGLVAPVLAVAGAAFFAWQTYRDPLAGAARIAGGSLITLMVVCGVLSFHASLAAEAPQMVAIYFTALLSAFALRTAFPSRYRIAVERLAAAAPPERTHLLLVFVSCGLMTLIQVAPEVVRYWNQSGWMDSGDYDTMAQSIASGVTPGGSGIYPPVYQYGLAALYWIFGHFFFVQQIANTLLAIATTACLIAAAWLLFRNLLVCWLAGVFAAHWEILHHATWYTQIEGWYVPIFAGSLLVLVKYMRSPTLRAVLLLGAAAGLVVATRQQGLFYAAGLGVAVLFARGLSLRRRGQQLAVFALLFVGIGFGPWTLRNYLVEGRMSPASVQSVELLAALNDPRVPLYGLRYWEQFGPVQIDWVNRYPDVDRRHQAMQAYFIERITRHPDYFVAAMPWRAAAFYGLLPESLLYGRATVSQLVANPLPVIVDKYRYWAPLLGSLLGLAFGFRRRTAWLLALLIPANVLVTLIVPSAEARLCFPVMGLNLLLALFAVASPAMAPGGSERANGESERQAGSSWRPDYGMAVATALFVVLVLHALLGRSNQYNAIIGATYDFRPGVAIDRSLPLADFTSRRLTVDGVEQTALQPGQRYRIRLRLTNQQFPPKHAIGLPGIDASLGQPGSVQYYLTANATDGGIVARYDGVIASQPLREGMTVEAEILAERVSDVFAGSPKFDWVRLEKAVVLGTKR